MHSMTSRWYIRAVRRLVLIFLAAVPFHASIAQGCSADWTPSLFGTAGIEGSVSAFIMFDDDGPGPNAPALIAAGSFTEAGSVPASNIAKWDGKQWSPLGSGLGGGVSALEVFDDDGAGPNPPRLYAGGSFWSAGGLPVNLIARWDGVSWSGVGGGLTQFLLFPSVRDLLVHDEDGPGPIPPALYVAGAFFLAGGMPANGLARWDGASWSVVGPSVPGGLPPNSMVSQIVAFDDDGLPSTPRKLAASGYNAMAPALGWGVATWDGTTWTFLGAPFDSYIHALEVFDPDGAGPAPEMLVAGGQFGAVGGVAASRVAAWINGAWAPLGSGIPGFFATSPVGKLATFDPDGAGPAAPQLLVAGSFTQASGGPGNAIAKWDGVSWTPLGTGLGSQDPSGQAFVGGLIVTDVDGPGPRPASLVVGGDFTLAGSIGARSIALWDGTSWSKLGNAIDGDVETLIEFDPDGAGPAPSTLGVGGNFNIQTVGGVASHFAFWSGTSWTPAGTGPGSRVYATVLHDLDGNPSTPPELIAGGDFGAAVWNGAAWLPIGNPPLGMLVRAFAVFDEDGPGPQLPLLFAGGGQTIFSGCSDVQKLVGGSWVQAWAPPFTCYQGIVETLAVFDEDGPGPALPFLFAAGQFQYPANNVAKWNGVSWQAVGGGLGAVSSDLVRCLTVFDLDAGGPAAPALFACGRFSSPANNVAQWNGSAWLGVAGGLSLPPPPPVPMVQQGSVDVLAVVDWDGPGGALPVLGAGGTFVASGSTQMLNVGYWDGTAWSALGTGITGGLPIQQSQPSAQGRVLAMTAFDVDGAGPMPPALFAGGRFTRAGSWSSVGLAKWATPAAVTLGFALGAAGLGISHSACVPGANYLTVFSLDPLNATAPGLGLLGGLHVGLLDAISQVQLGVPPFAGVLNASGTAQLTVPSAVIAPLAGQTLYGISFLYDATPLPYWESASPIASITL